MFMCVCTCLYFIVGTRYPYKDSKTWTFWQFLGDKIWKIVNDVTMQICFLWGVGDKTYSLVRIKVIEVYEKSLQFTETNVCVKYYEYIKVRGSLSLFSPEERADGAARGSEGIWHRRACFLPPAFFTRGWSHHSGSNRSAIWYHHV